MREGFIFLSCRFIRGEAYWVVVLGEERSVQQMILIIWPVVWIKASLSVMSLKVQRGRWGMHPRYFLKCLGSLLIS